jgi:hypothetical protein
MTAFDPKKFPIINLIPTFVILSYLILVCIRVRNGAVFSKALKPDPA